MKYREIKYYVDAFQMTKERIEDKTDWPEWLRKAWDKDSNEDNSLFFCYIESTKEDKRLVVNVPWHGWCFVDPNDWIVLHHGIVFEVHSEDVFKGRYEKVNQLDVDELKDLPVEN